MSKLFSRKMLVLAVGLICLTIGGVAALSVTNLDPFKISVFSQSISSTNFLASTKSVNLLQTGATIKLTVTNNGAAQHTANVTVTTYNSGGTELYSITNVIADLAAGASVTSTFTFTQAQGVTQSTYNGHDIQIVETA